MRFQLIKSLLLTAAITVVDISTAQAVPKTNEQTITPVISEAKSVLMAKLAQTAFFSANFTQQVMDEEGNKLQQSQGKLVVKKPNLVYWQTTQPDPSLIVSDGDNLWFYDPFIEQASVYTVDASIANTPILLLTSSDENLWQQYNISSSATNKFLITSKDINSRVSQLTLTFVADSHALSSIEIVDSTGQTSMIRLENLDSQSAIDEQLFHFTVPEGSYLDDQR